jgi:hypothetical protein
MEARDPLIHDESESFDVFCVSVLLQICQHDQPHGVFAKGNDTALFGDRFWNQIAAASREDCPL